MPWSGSGSFARTFGATGWTDDKNSSVFILSSRHDTHDQDLADGINLCITKDGQSKPAADIKPNLDASYSLGSNALRWKNIFLSGSISAGSVISSLTKRKTAATFRNSTTTLTADPDLVVALTAGTYSISGFLSIGNFVFSDSSGFKMDFSYTGTVTSGAIGNTGYVNGATTGRPANTYNTAQAYTTVTPFGISTSDFISLIGTITVSTSGTLSLRWSQNTSTTTDVGIDAGSWISLAQIN